MHTQSFLVLNKIHKYMHLKYCSSKTLMHVVTFTHKLLNLLSQTVCGWWPPVFKPPNQPNTTKVPFWRRSSNHIQVYLCCVDAFMWLAKKSNMMAWKGSIFFFTILDIIYKKIKKLKNQLRFSTKCYFPQKKLFNWVNELLQQKALCLRGTLMSVTSLLNMCTR